MEEEQGSPDYAFLFDLTSKEHIYYRWGSGGMLSPAGCLVLGSS